ncbi:hypothetical protein [Nocardioides sp.]
MASNPLALGIATLMARRPDTRPQPVRRRARRAHARTPQRRDGDG